MTNAHVAEALSEVVGRIRNLVLEVLRDTPPELAADIYDRGILLAGGGALLPELDQELRDASGLPVMAAEAPLHCVALGAEILLGDPELFSRLTIAG